MGGELLQLGNRTSDSGPPYVEWKFPGELATPDHLREAVELYNARIHAPVNEPPILHQKTVSTLEMR